MAPLDRHGPRLAAWHNAVGGSRVRSRPRLPSWSTFRRHALCESL